MGRIADSARGPNSSTPRKS